VSEPNDPGEHPEDELPRPEPDDIAMIRAVDRAVGVVEVALLCLFLATLIGVAVFNFIANHLLDHNPTWTDELIRYSVFFTAWTGAALAAQTDQLLNMDVITRLVRPMTRVTIRIFTRALTLVACGFLVWGGFKVRGIVAGEDYEVISKGTVALAFPVGALLVGFHVFLHLIIDILYLVRRQEPPEAHVSLH